MSASALDAESVVQNQLFVAVERRVFEDTNHSSIQTYSFDAHFGPAVKAGLFLGQLPDYNDQQRHYDDADQGPSPHSSGRPSVCSVDVIHA